jgi:thiamine transport system substrate-binding protein
MAPRAVLALALLTAALAGCTGAPQPASLPGEGYQAMGFDGTTWPDLQGAKVTVLGYGAAAYVFGELEGPFRNLTNGTLELVTADDGGDVLQRAIREKGNPTFDVLYGIDNVLLGKALKEGVFEPYCPLLKHRIQPGLRFVPDCAATPVNHGYIAVNVDASSGLQVRTLDDVKANARTFVTQDPRTSTPGLGFLISTVATYGEDDAYDYQDYWRDLLQGGAMVTSGWTEAYAGQFTGGYGKWEEGFAGTKALVTSYTTSPAYEVYYGAEQLNGVVLAPNSTFHQVQTVGIAKGARNLAAAQAFVEFALTEHFQGKAASHEAIYPAAMGVGVAEVFGGKDPAPGTFQPAPTTFRDLDAKVEGWIRGWTDVYERARAGA